MSIERSLWFSTRSALFRPGDEAWSAIAAYEEPLRRFIERRFAWLGATDKDDLVQEILLDMKRKLAPRHDPARGRFRALLQTVIKRRVADRLRARRARPLDGHEDAQAAPSEEAVSALDLEARLLAAVAACRDRFSQGPERDLDVLYALVDRIVHGLPSKEIARRTGASVDRVARLLEKGRDAIFEGLLAGELGLERGDARLARGLALFKEALRAPRAAHRLLDRERDAALRAGLDELLARFRAALAVFAGDETARGIELRGGLEFILGEVKRPPPRRRNR